MEQPNPVETEREAANVATGLDLEAGLNCHCQSPAEGLRLSSWIRGPGPLGHGFRHLKLNFLGEWDRPSKRQDTARALWIWGTMGHGRAWHTNNSGPSLLGPWNTIRILPLSG